MEHLKRKKNEIVVSECSRVELRTMLGLIWTVCNMQKQLLLNKSIKYFGFRKHFFNQ